MNINLPYIYKYTVVTGYNLAELCNLVNEYINDRGYQPYGPMVTTEKEDGFNYHQPMVTFKE